MADRPRFAFRVRDVGAGAHGINTHHVVSWREDESGYCSISMSNGKEITVRETFDQVSELMGGVREAKA